MSLWHLSYYREAELPKNKQIAQKQFLLDHDQPDLKINIDEGTN